MASLFSCWLCLFLPTSHNTKAKKVNDEFKTDSKHGGGVVRQNEDVHKEGGQPRYSSTNMNKGRERRGGCYLNLIRGRKVPWVVLFL